MAGSLIASGDVGTYVFSRLADMFEFFRSPMTSDGRLYINDSYWAEAHRHQLQQPERRWRDALRPR